MRKLLITPTTVAALVGCGTMPSYTPLVDHRNSDPVKMADDMRDCNAYAATQMDSGTGALLGALLGAVAFRGTGYGNEFAGIGAASGYMAAENNQRTIVSRCLAGRGYSVLQ